MKKLEKARLGEENSESNFVRIRAFESHLSHQTFLLVLAFVHYLFLHLFWVSAKWISKETGLITVFVDNWLTFECWL